MAAKGPDNKTTEAVKRWLWAHTFAWVDGHRSWSGTGWTISQPDWGHWRGQAFKIEWSQRTWTEIPSDFIAAWIYLHDADHDAAVEMLDRARKQ